MKNIETILKELNTKKQGVEYFTLPKGRAINSHTGKPDGEVSHTRKTEFTPPKFTIPKKR